MSDHKTSYRQIVKSTSLFGGVQVFTIIFAIIRTKFIAILLGPAGIGIVGLLNSTISFISALTNFGLERSAVKNIALSNAHNDKGKISLTVSILRKLVWITGIFGALITIIFSSSISELTFGNKDYSSAFVWLSITLLVNQISIGQTVVLRGMQKLRFMAKSSLWGSLLGLIVSVPIYYFWGLDGIVPAIIISSLFALFISFHYSSKVGINTINPNNDEFYQEGRDMLKMGLILSLSSLIVLAESYLVRIYIRQTGSIEDVGFYNAGIAIVNTYFGVIFVALTTDYYPKLAAIANDFKKSTLLMNQQSEMTILLIAPILVVFLTFIKPIVIILYSKEFLPINEMILWAALGIYFKAASWALGVIFISKGDVKTLFLSELSATLIMLILNLAGYKYLGLEGLGISFFLAFIFAYIQTFTIVKFKYSFSYSIQFYKIYFIHLTLGIMSFFVMRYVSNPINYYLGIIIILISLAYSLKLLEKRTGFLTFIINKFYKNE